MQKAMVLAIAAVPVALGIIPVVKTYGPAMTQLPAISSTATPAAMTAMAPAPASDAKTVGTGEAKPPTASGPAAAKGTKAAAKHPTRKVASAKPHAAPAHPSVGATPDTR